MIINEAISKQLNEIVNLISSSKFTGDNGALIKFNLYLDEIQNMGSFDPFEWQGFWRDQIRSFGGLFKNQNPSQFLAILDEKIKVNNNLNKEALEFIKSQIELNFMPGVECKLYFKDLIRIYPLNPEFRFSLGQCFYSESDFVLAITEYKIAIKIDPENKTFVEARVDAEQQYLDKIIDSGDVESAEKYITELLSDLDFINWGENRNIFKVFARRIKDQQMIQKKVSELEFQFKEKMRAELDHERRKIIEITGFFTAIVAFLLSTVSIGENFSFLEALYFIISLGAILILFVTSIYVIFSTDRTKLVRDKRFWILISGLVILLVLVLDAGPIAKILGQILR